MPIDYTDMTAIVDILKNVYGGLTEQFDYEPITYNQFPKSDRKCGGNGYFAAVAYENPQGIGFRDESTLLPPPLVGKWDQIKILPKSAYGVLRLSGQSIDLAKGGVESFVNNMSANVNGIYEAILDQLNVASHGDGFGLIATLSAASDTPSATVATTWTVTCDNDRGLMYAREGQVVDFFESTVPDQQTIASRIYSIDIANKTCEMEGNADDYSAVHPDSTLRGYSFGTAAVATGAYMVRMGTREASHLTTNTPKEITGLDGIFDDSTLITTFQNIDASTYTKWQANVLGNSSVNRELTEDLMLQAVNLSRLRSKEKKIVIRMGQGQQRKLYGLYANDRRFTPGEFRGGFETLNFSVGGACEILIDPMTQPNSMYFEPVKNIKKYEAVPLGWATLDQMWSKRAGYDEYEAFLVTRTNLGTEQRNVLTKISDLVEPNIYS